MDEAMRNRLRAHASVCLVAIPDDDGGVASAMQRLDELLHALGQRDEPTTPSEVTADAGYQALDGLYRGLMNAEVAPPAQPIAPDGRYELVPLSWVQVEPADVDNLGLTVQALGRALACGTDHFASDALTVIAELYHRTAADLVAEGARLHGLFSLPWDDDVTRLAALLPAGAGRVVLDTDAHEAYVRLTNRILGIWHAGETTARWLYRGH
jgi:hypothetical protein